jgi:hypothetical protein
VFVTVQLPLTDARHFVEAETWRLPRPVWTLARDQGDFIRATGPLRPRSRGGIWPWPGEEVYCDAKRALRFWPPLGQFWVTVGEDLVGFRCAYRRLCADGVAVARMEVGLGVRSVGSGFKEDDLVHLVAGVMEIPVLVRQLEATTATRLLQAGQPLARRILRSTTAHAGMSKPATTRDWWVQCGTPLVLLEHRREELASIASVAQVVQLPEQPAIHLSHFIATLKGIRVGVWLVEYGEEAPREALRRLRVHLSRLHSEREALRNILRLVADKRLDIGSRTPTADRLQEYLNDQLRTVQRPRRFGFDQEPILEAAYASQGLVDAGIRASLDSELERARRNYARNVQLALASQTTHSAAIYDLGEPREAGVIYDYRGATVYDMQKKIEIGDVGQLSGFVGFDSVVAGSFNRIESSGVGTDAQELLKALGESVASLGRTLPEDTAKQVARDYETLVDEAISPSPRKSILAAVGSQVIEVAQTAATVGVPVIDLVQKVLAFF